MSQVQEVAGKTVAELLECGCASLDRAGIREAREECMRILMKLQDSTRFALQLNAKKSVSLKTEERFLALIEKRQQRIPLAYLLQESGFWQETLFVNKHCLIPRPETEILVESVLNTLKRDGKEVFSVLDVGTGSGAIAIAILRFFKKARGTLLDISPAALEVARENLKRYALEGRAALVQGSFFQPFRREDQWDIIVSNPPYLAAADWNAVQEELKAEPREALDGGVDGLDHYRCIVAEAKNHLFRGGMLALEVGQGQAETVSKWLQDAGYDSIQVFEDYLKIQRVVMARKDS